MNSITQRIYDFLKDFPPFSMLSKEQLFSVCASIEVGYYEKDDILFDTDAQVQPIFYVVKDGAIGLYRGDSNVLVDECDEGDIFGLRALMRQGNYKLTAKAIEESVVYIISKEGFEQYIAPNAEASRYLLSSFASNTLLSENQTASNSLLMDKDFFEEQSATYSKNPVYCNKATSIKEAALIMAEKRVGSIVITEAKKPIGIITDKDLRMKVATGKIPITASVLKIMSSPVITFPENITVAEAQIAMIRNNITHLCITEDGTSSSSLRGILSQHDIIVLRENNASALVKEIKRANNAEQLRVIRIQAQELLKRYLKQEIPIAFVANIITVVNESITKKLIDLAIAKQSEPLPTNFSWMSLGSQGRQEQLLLTDQDNALVFANVPEENYERVQKYFVQLAQAINKDLETVGFELCPANMMAGNPKWCMSVEKWQSQFENWITKPDQDKLMLCTIFFDFQQVYGDFSLVNQLAESIFSAIEDYEIFLNFLGANALQNPPPLSFFRQFLVEQSGEHKDQFDIKARAMMPLVDAARLLVLSKHIKDCNNTLKRFDKLIELEPQNKDVYEASIEAYKNLLTFRTRQGLQRGDSGRFIDLASLNKHDRLELKRCFVAIKDIQSLIETRFKLSNFR